MWSRHASSQPKWHDIVGAQNGAMLPNVGLTFHDLLPTCCQTRHLGPKIGNSDYRHAQLGNLVWCLLTMELPPLHPLGCSLLMRTMMKEEKPPLSPVRFLPIHLTWLCCICHCYWCPTRRKLYRLIHQAHSCSLACNFHHFSSRRAMYNVMYDLIRAFLVCFESSLNIL